MVIAFGYKILVADIKEEHWLRETLHCAKTLKMRDFI